MAMRFLILTFLLTCSLVGQTPRAASRLLEQAAWGPTPVAIADVQKMGLEPWLTAQFALNTSDLPDQPILDASMKPNNNLAPVQSAFFVNTITGQDQLRQRVAFALSQIWVVAATELPSAYAYPSYWRIFRDNAFGNYRDIMKAVTLNPAMGHYLNMANDNKAGKGTSANENYARELMQLFTVGLLQLNPDGSPVLDASGNPIPTYTQAQVTQTAKALTGWTYPTAPGATAKNNNPSYYIGQMFAVEAEHDLTSRQIIGGVTIPAGQSAENDLNAVLNALIAQPSMAPFISKQLIQHLVTSNPSPDYVERVSRVFSNNGTGVKGDMKAVITAILMDPEARAADDPTTTPVVNFGHLREPILWTSSLLRGLNATTVPVTNTIGNAASAMGERLFYEASVFSYFSPEFSVGRNLLGPEFQIYTTQTASTTANNVYSAIYGGSLGGVKVNLAPFMQYSGNLPALINSIDSIFMHSSMSAMLRQQITDAAVAATTPTRVVQAALYIALTSNEFNVIH